MSNPETRPEERWCGPGAGAAAATAPATHQVQVLDAREVPLGGPRAMTVRRTLPQRARSLIGAWCFADHYGPEDVASSGGMDVPPHPHTGLQTVSWLFSGEVEHRDSGGVHAVIRPGELNLMTGGHGICHSEVSTPDTTVLHGAQLWVALPEAHRSAPRRFQHHVPEPVRLGGAVIRVFLGRLGAGASPVQTFTPLLGAEIVLDPGAVVELDVDQDFEHGVLVDEGTVAMAGTLMAAAQLGFQPAGASTIALANLSQAPARVLLLGGPPFREEILMWWNFVARSHEEILVCRRAWESGSDRFGSVDGYQGAVQRLPAPALPSVRIRPRRNR